MRGTRLKVSYRLGKMISKLYREESKYLRFPPMSCTRESLRIIRENRERLKRIYDGLINGGPMDDYVFCEANLVDHQPYTLSELRHLLEEELMHE